MNGPAGNANGPSASALKLRMLDLEQVRRIDEMLASIGDYGEVHLVIQHGELRYINRVESHKAWNDDGKRRRQEP
jgi:hypothetical protein